MSPEDKEKYKQLIANRRIIDGCWEWTKSRNQRRTPMTTYNRRSLSVRKCIYMLHYGVKSESPVYSKCGNLLCFNPEHITLNPPDFRKYY